MFKIHHVKNLYSTEKNLLKFVGYYPTSNTNYIFKALGIFVFILEYTHFTLMTIFTFKHLADAKPMVEALLYLFTQIAFVTKLTNFIFNKRMTKELEDILDDPLIIHGTDEDTIIIEEFNRSVNYFTNIFRVGCVIVVTFYSIFPFIDEGSNPLPLRLWFPFDEHNYFVSIYSCEFLSIFFGVWLNSAFDILCIKHMSIVAAQFEILKKKLKGLTDEKINGVPVRKSVLKKLENCIQHYNLLLRYAHVVETTFSIGILVQFTSSVCVICVTGLQLLVISVRSAQFTLFLTYFLCMVGQVIMYCWFGHFIMYSSSNIIEACYMCDWLTCHPDIRKILILIMERAKRPVYINAANFFTLSLPTMITILKTSYSYFAVLQHIYTKK